MRDEALRYMDRGWGVFPVHGKVPVTEHGLHDATTEPDGADKWWPDGTDRGIGLATGEASGVWVVDLDGDEGRQAFVELQERHEQLPPTVASKTGNGVHLFFRVPPGQEIRNSASKIAPKIDVRGTGGYVVLPPSPHPSGKQYEWVKGRSPDDLDVGYAPTWLVTAATSSRSRATTAVAAGEPIPSGARNDTLASLAGTMRKRGMAREAIAAALHAENIARCVPPLEQDEVEKIADSVARYEPGEPRQNGSPPGGEPPPTTQLELVDAVVLERIAAEKSRPVDAVETPWHRWNRACRGAGGGKGLARGWHVIIGASSGAGKSLVAANITATALRSGVDVCLFSLEMSQLENVTRILAILTGEPVALLEHGTLFNLDRWNAAVERFLEQPGSLRTNERPIHTLSEIESAMRHHADEGSRLMIVDYLQLAWVGSADTLYQQITEVSHTVQGLAKDLNVTTVGLSQVNRRTSTGGSRLEKEGLMGGSSLENDAEMVVLLSKPERTKEEGQDGFLSDARLDKNRHGPVSEWRLFLDPTTLTLKERAP